MTVYFDNAATTRVRDEAAGAMLKMMTENYGNPSSTHLAGREAAKALKSAREALAKAIGAQPDEIYFTSGGTEADNWAILGASELKGIGSRHMISSLTEHDAVRKSVDRLEEKGWEISRLSPDRAGRITPEAFASALRPDTAIVSLMLVNNEMGAVNDIPVLAKALKSANPRALFHTDAVQALGKLPVNVKSLGADMVSLSSHKIGGPKGCGALWIRKGLNLRPLHLGGGQEKGLRPGTEALPCIVGLSTAAELAAKELKDNSAKLRSLRDRAVALLKESIPDTVFIGEGDAPQILSISLPGYGSEVLMNYLDARGIMVSKSSACKKGARSHVLEAMALPKDVIDGALRISFWRDNTPEEVDYFVATLSEAVKSLRHR